MSPGVDMKMRALLGLLAPILLLLVAATSCAGPPDAAGRSEQDGRLRVVATTTIVGDVVAQVGGEAIELTVLLPTGADPHSYDPAPADVATVADAEVIFSNGLGLEDFLQRLLDNAGHAVPMISLSDGLASLESSELDEDAPEAEEHQHGDGVDPHTWTDPNNVMVWVDFIRDTLMTMDPDHQSTYEANASAYQAALQSLDGWITEQVDRIPEQDRRLVTDHALFGYFAQRYGFEQVGTLIPGYNTLAEPSAKEMAQLESTVADLGVKAIFVGNTVNPDLARRIANDTGTRLVFLYTGSLSDPDGDAPSYLDYVQYNVSAIVEALSS